MRTRAVRAICSALAIIVTAAWQPPPSHGAFLYVWTGDSAMRSNDFLAVLDADPASKTYGSVVTTVQVPVAGMPHHTEHQLAANDHLLADDFSVGRSFLFDLSDARRPKLLTSFDDRGGFSHPHSYFRLADGNVIATFQYAGKVAPLMMMHGAEAAKHPSPYRRGGGLVVMDERGVVKRVGSAFVPQIDSGVYPYSVLALPKIDRAISTATGMDEGDVPAKGTAVQVWRLSDLTLLRTFQLPRGPRGDEQLYSGEVRMLPDGHSLYVHTFGSGLYLLDTRTLDTARAALVKAFPGHECGVPLVASHYWLQPVPSEHALLALDVTDPVHPREVSRVTFDTTEHPHWIALDPTGRRIVLNSAENGRRIYVVNFDPTNGKLAIDERFRDAGSKSAGVSFTGRKWPQGMIQRATPHGAVFSR